MSDRFVRILIHLAVIVIIFVLPEVMMEGDRPPHHDRIRWVPYIKVAIFVMVFYLEYFLVRPAVSRKWLFAGSLLILAAGTTGMFILMNFMDMPGPYHPSYSHVVIRDVAILLMVMGLSVAMRLSERMHQIKSTHREEELKQLKSQINPHFLFNSLNTVYALTEIDPTMAREAVHRLSALLRYALYESDSTTVKLRREVDFINDYVRLMQMRLGERVKVSMVEEIEPDMENVEIASMLFVTLVENAFKHGGEGYVSIRISANSREGVECDVANSVSSSVGDDKIVGGMGLENLRRRLRLIYGDKARLDISSQPTIFVAQMRIKP